MEKCVHYRTRQVTHGICTFAIKPPVQQTVVSQAIAHQVEERTSTLPLSDRIHSFDTGSLALQWLTGNSKTSFQLKTPSGYINGTDWQCIVYYYYMQMDGGKMISVRKEEADNTSEIIDSVTSSPFNGWIRRQVAFNVGTRQYKVGMITSTRSMVFWWWWIDISALFWITKDTRRNLCTLHGFGRDIHSTRELWYSDYFTEDWHIIDKHRSFIDDWVRIDVNLVMHSMSRVGLRPWNGSHRLIFGHRFRRTPIMPHQYRFAILSRKTMDRQGNSCLSPRLP